MKPTTGLFTVLVVLMTAASSVAEKPTATADSVQVIIDTFRQYLGTGDIAAARTYLFKHRIAVGSSRVRSLADELAHTEKTGKLLVPPEKEHVSESHSGNTTVSPAIQYESLPSKKQPDRPSMRKESVQKSLSVEENADTIGPGKLIESRFKELVSQRQFDTARSFLFKNRMAFSQTSRNELIRLLTEAEKGLYITTGTSAPGTTAKKYVRDTVTTVVSSPTPPGRSPTSSRTPTLQTESKGESSKAPQGDTRQITSSPDTPQMHRIAQSDTGGSADDSLGVIYKPEEFWSGFGAWKAAHASDTAYLGFRVNPYMGLIGTGGYVDLSFGPKMNMVFPSYAQGHLELGALIGRTIPNLGLRSSPGGRVKFKLGLQRPRTPLFYSVSYTGGGIFPIPENKKDQIENVERYRWSTMVDADGGLALQLADEVALTGYGTGNWYYAPTDVEYVQHQLDQINGGGGAHILISPIKNFGILILGEGISGNAPLLELPGVGQWDRYIVGTELQYSSKNVSSSIGVSLKSFGSRGIGVYAPILFRKGPFSLHVIPEKIKGYGQTPKTIRVDAGGSYSYYGKKGKFSVKADYRRVEHEGNLFDIQVCLGFTLDVWGSFAPGKLIAIRQDLSWFGYRYRHYSGDLRAFESSDALELFMTNDLRSRERPEVNTAVSASAGRLGLVGHNTEYFIYTGMDPEFAADSSAAVRREILRNMEHAYNMAVHEGRITEARKVAYKLWVATKDKWWLRQLQKLMKMPSESSQ